MASLAHLGAMKFSSSYLLCNDYFFISLWRVRSIINLLSYKRKRNRLLSIRIFQLIHTKNTKEGRNTFHLKNILFCVCVCVCVCFSLILVAFKQTPVNHKLAFTMGACHLLLQGWNLCSCSWWPPTPTPGRSSGWSAETRHSVLLENGQNRPSDSWTFSGADFMSPAPVSPYI